MAQSPSVADKRNGSAASHIELGKKGEEIAANWLRGHGYYILDRNWKSRSGHELDIVAEKDHQLHIIEVKTRSQKSAEYSAPETAVNRKRMERMVRGGALYRKHYGLNWEMMIHAIAIVYRADDDFDLRFIPNIHNRQMSLGYYRSRY